MENGILWQSLGIIICLVLSGFFSASETAFTSLNRIRMKNKAMNGDRRAERALKLADRYDALLSTILIGNNIVNIVSASLGTLAFTTLLGPAVGVPVSTAVITIAVLIFGEISPKSLAKEHAEGLAMTFAPALQVLMIVFTPLNFVFGQWKRLLSRVFKSKKDEQMTPEELMTIVDEAQSGGGLDDASGELIRSAIEFDDLAVADVLTPRVDIVAVEKNDTLEEIAETFAKHSFSRLPVYEDTIDNIIGMIQEKEFFCGLRGGISSIDTMIKKLSYISPGMKISDFLRLLQQSKTHMAVVIDEFGGTAGIATLEDALEELVGDIWDENDVVIDYFQPLGEQRYQVDCSAALEDMFDHFSLTTDYQYECVTVGGWVMEHLGKIPVVGDEFRYEGLRVQVTKVTAHHPVEIVMQFPEEEKAEK